MQLVLEAQGSFVSQAAAQMKFLPSVDTQLFEPHAPLESHVVPLAWPVEAPPSSLLPLEPGLLPPLLLLLWVAQAGGE